MAAHIENFYLALCVNGMSTDANKITLCTSEPTDYTSGNSTYPIASATGGAGYTAPLLGASATRAPNGQQTTSATISGAAVSGTGTAAWVAFLDTTHSRLVAVLAMTSQALTSGNTWGAAGVVIGMPNQ